jgi:hypothetical protein
LGGFPAKRETSAPLILCKEDLEILKIFFAKYQRSLGKDKTKWRL